MQKMTGFSKLTYRRCCCRNDANFIEVIWKNLPGRRNKPVSDFHLVGHFKFKIFR